MKNGLIQKGVNRLKCKDFAAGIQLLSEALACPDDTYNAVIHYNLACGCFCMGAIKEARRHLLIADGIADKQYDDYDYFAGRLKKEIDTADEQFSAGKQYTIGIIVFLNVT